MLEYRKLPQTMVQNFNEVFSLPPVTDVRFNAVVDTPENTLNGGTFGWKTSVQLCALTALNSTEPQPYKAPQYHRPEGQPA